jgi:hypothetical protein
MDLLHIYAAPCSLLHQHRRGLQHPPRLECPSQVLTVLYPLILLSSCKCKYCGMSLPPLFWHYNLCLQPLLRFFSLAECFDNHFYTSTLHTTCAFVLGLTSDLFVFHTNKRLNQVPVDHLRCISFRSLDLHLLSSILDHSSSSWYGWSPELISHLCFVVTM